MDRIFVITRDLPDWGQFEIVGFFNDKDAAEQYAERREQDDHEVESRREASDLVKVLPPASRTYRKFRVQEISSLD